MEVGDPPVDVGRLAAPRPDAFRHIAHALGAAYEGDAPSEATGAPAHTGEPGEASAPAPRAARVSAHECGADPRAATLLERMPLAVVAMVEEAIVHMNRAAIQLFGFRSAEALEGAGGIGALFGGADPGMPGIVTMRTATGARFGARVSMGRVAWGRGSAILFTILPASKVAGPGDRADGRQEPAGGWPDASDPLLALLDANPDPIAVLTRGGQVEVCNRAFRELTDGTAPDLATLLEPDALQSVFDAMRMAFLIPRGTTPTAIFEVAGRATFASVGALPGGRLACLVLHAVGDAVPHAHRTFDALRGEGASAVGAAGSEPSIGHPDDPDPPGQAVDAVLMASGLGPCGSPLYRAVHTVRRLVRDAAVLIVSDEDEGEERPGEGDPEAEHELMRTLLLALTARAAIGSVLTVRRAGESVVLEGPYTLAGIAAQLLTSQHLTVLARAAQRSLRLEGDALVITPIAGTISKGLGVVKSAR